MRTERADFQAIQKISLKLKALAAYEEKIGDPAHPRQEEPPAVRNHSSWADWLRQIEPSPFGDELYEKVEKELRGYSDAAIILANLLNGVPFFDVQGCRSFFKNRALTGQQKKDYFYKNIQRPLYYLGLMAPEIHPFKISMEKINRPDHPVSVMSNLEYTVPNDWNLENRHRDIKTYTHQLCFYIAYLWKEGAVLLTEEEIQKKKNSFQITEAPDHIDVALPLPNLSYVIVETSIVVTCDSSLCRKENHDVRSILGRVHILKPDGESIEKLVPCYYCMDCNFYFLPKDTYEWLAKQGTLQCEVVDETYYRSALQKGGNAISNADTESVLKLHGYNVQAKNGLTPVDRQNILAQLIDQNILSAVTIASYIRFFIITKKGLSNYKNAVAKWQADLAFVENYRNEEKPVIDVNRIVKKYTIPPNTLQ